MQSSSYCADFAPKNLTPEERYKRKDISAKLLEMVEEEPHVMNRVITGDEFWSFGYNPAEGKISCKNKEDCTSNLTVRCMLVCFFDCRGIIYKKWIPTEQRVDSKYYVDILKKLRAAVNRRRQRISNDWILHQDNVPFHNTSYVKQFLQKADIDVLPHPPYSPDLAPCDFFLFQKIKKIIENRSYKKPKTCQDIKKTVETVLNNVSENEFKNCYKQWQIRWKKCVKAQGDYFEDSACSSNSAGRNN